MGFVLQLGDWARGTLGDMAMLGATGGLSPKLKGSRVSDDCQARAWRLARQAPQCSNGCTASPRAWAAVFS